MPRRVLVVSASMGAGHDHAAAELARRLVASDYHVEVVDFLHLMPFGLGRALRATYTFQLRHCAWTYELGYRALGAAGNLLWRINVLLVSVLTRRSVSKLIMVAQPDAVVSTYPFASLVLGHLRATGELRVPAVTYLTDFAVHPLWVHSGIDLHLAVSGQSAEAATRRGAGASIGTGPLVADRFRAPVGSRDEVRHRLGIPTTARVALVVAGSLGLGTMPDVVEAVTTCGNYHVIAVCGRNAKLQVALAKAGFAGTVLGWTDDMPELMSASDVLIENAGGLTAMEAFAAGLPVVTYRAIAGHGRDNASSMNSAMVSRYARTEAELAVSLHDATTPGIARDALVAAGRALFADDPAAHVIALAKAAPTRPVVWVPQSRTTRVRGVLSAPARLPKGLRRVAVPLVMLLTLYGALTEGAETVAALGVGVAKAPAGAQRTVYLGIRLTGAELRDRHIRQSVETSNATAIVDARAARTSRQGLVELASAGVDVANGGWGTHTTLPWTRSRNDCQRAGQIIAQVAQVRPAEFVPGRELNAFDQLYCRIGHYTARLVRPTRTFSVAGLPDDADSGRIYMLDGRGAQPGVLQATLAKFQSEVMAAGLRIRPFSDLR